MAKIIAFYLPQFHPIKENDEWYGKGYTEWRIVAATKKQYRGHYQPHIPADLGFYDLRLKQTLIEQVKLANQYGVDGFCYWHYWFGNGKELLEQPFKMLLADKTIKIDFSLAWANHSWNKKGWSPNEKDELLVSQEYLGRQDYEKHFYAYLDAFKDPRYTKVDDKPLFIIFSPLASPQIECFINVWRELAHKEGIGDFYFVGHDINGMNKAQILNIGFDAVYDDRMLEINNRQNNVMKFLRKIKREVLHCPVVFDYKDAIKYMVTDDSIAEDIIPTVVPNWDHTPRDGGKGIILDNCKPEYFELLLNSAIKNIKNKPQSKQIILVKSWNEWGEGNYLEPDMKYGKGYLKVIQKARKENGL
ncbi:glycoside hydrolase family 99-like domain-containing protein [uncultured Anaerovibrio sp.]|uniref:glycosyltransferase WbsX family protein n=1 Tax=uncultured Anaerovibrio sp. TaxID=361586 RepID=UPI002604B06C|nr:glycoside hydrolase family 99-like domain-containing protein [uncultured Anaerovibrio sp.]